MKTKTSSTINLLLAIFLTATHSAFTLAKDLDGVWQTEPGDSGGYLHVEFTKCHEYLCGVIVAAYEQNNELDPEYANIGKKIVWDMQEKDPNKWNDGEIWDPEKDKTYSSKMSLDDEELKVSGCIIFICRSQVWKKVDSSNTGT